MRSGELLRRSGSATSVRVLGATAGFAFQVSLARALGAADLGVYYLASTIAQTAGTASRLGLDNALLRRASAAHAGREFGTVAGTLRAGMRIAAASACIAVAALWLSSSQIATWLLPGSTFDATLKVLALSIVPVALSSLWAEFFKAAGRENLGSVIQGLALPALNLAGLLALTTWIASATAAAVLYTACATMVLVACVPLWSRVFPWRGVARRPAAHDGLLREAWPMYQAALAAVVTGSADTIVLGIYGAPADIGVYGASWRVAILFGLISLGIGAIVAPRFAQLHSSGRGFALRSLCLRSCLVSAGVGVLPLLACLLAPERILGLFGPEFAAGAPLLQLLAIGRFLVLASAPVGHMLQMAGRADVERTLAVGAAAGLVATTLALTPAFGAVGTAAGVCLAIGGSGIVRGVVGWRLLRRVDGCSR